MIDDHNEHWQMPDLLRSIPKPVVEAIIDNTLGYKYSTDDQFKKLFLELDGCAGVYLNTFVVKGRNKGLTGNEWRDLAT